MVFVLLAVLIIGLALYETGYGVTNTWFKSLRKQTIVQASAISAFLVACHFFLPNLYNTPSALIINLGFLSMLSYIATATIRDCHLTAIASAVIGGLLFPVLVHFSGSIGYFSTIKYIDNAGSGVVHFVGGAIALIASLYTSKIKKSVHPIVVRPYSATLGFLVLWLDWLAYVGVISIPVLQADPNLWIKGLINLSTATAWGALAAVAYMWLVRGRAKMRTCTVGGLAGLVIMSASPFAAPFWAAALIGAVGGLAATMMYGFLCKHDIADPSNAISIHLLPGFIGALIVPLYNSEAFFTSQISGLSVLTFLATSMGVVICEVHNLTKSSRVITR